MNAHAIPAADRLAVIQTLMEGIVARISALPDMQTESVRSVRRELSRELVDAKPATVLALALRLSQDHPEEPYRFVAYELVHFHPAALRALNAANLERLGAGMDDWVTVDTFACYLSGPAWREGEVPDSLIHRWARSKDRWWRRAALVSTVALNTRTRGGQGDARRTLELCALLVGDRDDMVVKAMSWALRELAKRDRQAVAEFVGTHGAVLAPRVLREVHNKLATGLKNPRKASLRKK